LGERKSALRILVGKTEERNSLGRPRRRRKGNIKIDFLEVRWGNVLDQSVTELGQVANSCKCGNKPLVSVKYGEFFE
jgi:hypothetical protein